MYIHTQDSLICKRRVPTSVPISNIKISNENFWREVWILDFGMVLVLILLC
jgi:hypothetical protein